MKNTRAYSTNSCIESWTKKPSNGKLALLRIAARINRIRRCCCFCFVTSKFKVVLKNCVLSSSVYLCMVCLVASKLKSIKYLLSFIVAVRASFFLYISSSFVCIFFQIHRHHRRRRFFRSLFCLSPLPSAIALAQYICMAAVIDAE